MGKRKPPTPTQKADARRLREIWDRVMEGSDKGTQDSFGDRYGIGSQGAVWQYLAGYMPLNIAVAGKFARGLGCRIDDFSPTIAESIRALVPLLKGATNHRLEPYQQEMLDAYENAPPDAQKVIKSSFAPFAPKRRRGERRQKE